LNLKPKPQKKHNIGLLAKPMQYRNKEKDAAVERTMRWSASAPANIALIKYMGKKDFSKNIPSNPSLSYTLNHLRSFVEIEVSTENEDRWEKHPQLSSASLSEKEQARFLSHFSFLKNFFNYTGFFYLRSANNFPASCGLASSASSFAALTLCAVTAFCELQNKPLLSRKDISQLARLGSGSACRSFFSPFALWETDYAENIDLPYQDLKHRVLLITRKNKKITSSQAHQTVLTSLSFTGRPERAQTRLQLLINALQKQDWKAAFELVWQEFWDMHCLFETAHPPFSYLLPESLLALNILRDFWEKEGDGPLVTMDAGPNIHLLFRPDQKNIYQDLTKKLSKSFQLFAPNEF